MRGGGRIRGVKQWVYDDDDDESDDDNNDDNDGKIR